MAVFGGSFDPVHNGHLFMAAEILRQTEATEVLFVPALVPPHKHEGQLSPAESRLGMLQLAIEPFAEFSVSDIELGSTANDSPYTIDTLTTLRTAFPEHRLRFVMGMDSLAALHAWYRATELASQFDFTVYPRPGVATPSFAALTAHFGGRNARKLLDSVLVAPSIPFSATEIRERLAQGGAGAAGMLPDSVLNYIRANGLYGTGKTTDDTNENAKKEI